MSKYAIVGRSGFLGGALAARLGTEVDSVATPETKVLFHFASHVHPDFDKNPELETEVALANFRVYLDYCAKHGIQFVYPSSALVYEQDTRFSRFKKSLEALAASYSTPTLGLRIFPVYGPGEYRTVISQWCQDMIRGKQPIVFGDGTQARDFIFIDDVVDQILASVEAYSETTQIVDIGTGVLTSFNSILQAINRACGLIIPPQYVPRPAGYSEGIVSKNPLPCKTSIEQGIHRIIESLRPIKSFQLA